MFERYVAIGDSSTEGLNDHDGNGGFRGWADRLAAIVARAGGGLQYANLAVRGRQTREIREEQLEPALRMEPDLVTCVAGMNDLLRPRFDLGPVMADIDMMFGAFRGIEATVLTFTFPPPGPGMPLSRLIVPRVVRYNRALRAVAERHGVLVLDLARLPAARDPRLWDEDRLHGNAAGHERMALGLAHTLGIIEDESWREELPPGERARVMRALVADLRWARTHALPWIVRHFRGQSSGDDATAKRPELAPLEI